MPRSQRGVVLVSGAILSMAFAVAAGVAAARVAPIAPRLRFEQKAGKIIIGVSFPVAPELRASKRPDELAKSRTSDRQGGCGG